VLLPRALIRRAPPFLVAAAIAAVCFIYRFNTLGGRLGGLDNDHFIQLARSVAVLHGEQPIRDFTDSALEALWPAPTYAASAVAQRAFGESLRSEALLTVGMLSIGAAGLFWVSSEFAGSIAMAALLALLAIALRPALYNYPKIVPFVLGAAMILAYARRPTTARAIVLGASVGIAALYRHDHGMYLGIAAAVLLFLVDRGRRLRRQLLILSATCAVMLLPGVLFAQMHGGFITYLRQCFEVSRQEASRTARPGVHFVMDWSQPLIVHRDPPAQPNARVAVRWTTTLTLEMRQRAEAELQLLEPIRRQDDWNWSYAIVRPSADHLAAIVRDTRVVDTDGVDRRAFAILASAPPQPSWFDELRRWHLAPGILTSDNAVPWLYLVAWLVVLSAAAMVFGPMSARPAETPNVPRPAIQALCVLGVLMLIALLRTANPSRLADVSVPVAIIGSWLLSAIVSALRSCARPIRFAAVVCLAALLCVTSGAVVVLADAGHQLRVAGFPSPNRIHSQWVTVWRDLGALPSNLNGIDEDLQRTAGYARRCTTPVDRIFVADNMPEIYYFANRGFAAGHNAFFSRFYSSESFQQWAIRRWEGQSVPIALTQPSDRFEQEFSKDYPLLAAYLRTHYRPAGTLRVEAGRMMEVWTDQRRSFSTDADTGLPCAQLQLANNHSN
jgi:hypothetical protein